MFFSVHTPETDIDEWFTAALKVWDAPVDDAVKISTACSFRLMVEVIFRVSPNHPKYPFPASWMKRAMFVSLSLLCVRCLTSNLWLVRRY
jgi:hypothetical protein